MEESGGKFKIIIIVLIFVLIVGMLVAGLLYLIYSPRNSVVNTLFTDNNIAVTKYPLTTPIDYSKM